LEDALAIETDSKLAKSISIRQPGQFYFLPACAIPVRRIFRRNSRVLFGPFFVKSQLAAWIYD
jgi:hypothetical protein